MRDGTLTIAGAGAKQHPDNVPLFTHPTPDDASGPAITADVHADAARYRWLRGEGFDRPAHMWVTTLSDQKPIVHTDLDAAIDRARQSGEEGK
jgi:hypothetical protein